MEKSCLIRFHLGNIVNMVYILSLLCANNIRFSDNLTKIVGNWKKKYDIKSLKAFLIIQQHNSFASIKFHFIPL